LGFPPDVGNVDVRTGTGGDDTGLVMGDMPGGVAGVRVLVYVGAGVGVGADVYRCGETGKATACVGCVEGEV
jgi:hypothetical protein